MLSKIISIGSVILLLILFSACSRPDAPVFKGVREVKIKEKSDDQMVLTAYADFYNPNNYKIILKQSDIQVLLNDKRITHFKQDYNLKIEKNSGFTVPMEAVIAQQDINNNLLSTALNLLLGRKLTVRYEGHIKVKAYGLRIRVPVTGESKIDPRDL